MNSEAKLMKELFERSPTRELEEVEKVNSVQYAERDVKEFCQTDSTVSVLSKLGEIVETQPGEAPRFMYVYATFGSGKTLLLKLIGFATGENEDTEHLAAELSNLYSGFNRFRRKLEKSHIDHLIPVFLNLLGRDITQEPPIALLIFEALGEALGYPTDPMWLLEWIWRLDVRYDLWNRLKKFHYDGTTFEEVMSKRAPLRGWLYKALPEMPKTSGTQYASEEGIRETILETEEFVNPDNFTPEDLRSKIRETVDKLEKNSDETYEFLIGLDEVALFIYNSLRRYREFCDTIETIFKGPTPIIGTGQWSLNDLQQSLVGETEKRIWFNEVKLEATDTEKIARKRWLLKKPEQRSYISRILEESEKWSLDFFENTESSRDEGDHVQAYPFREYDLWLLRRVMEKLITRGRPTHHEYIQGRALLVLVRSLFTTFGWNRKEVGNLVPWDTLYDLLTEETTLVPTWVQEKIQTWDETFGYGSLEVRAAKVLYLVNQLDLLPSSSLNIAKLLLSNVDEDLKSLHMETKEALKGLQEYIYTDEEEGYQVYRLLSEEAFTIAEEINEEIGNIPSYQLGARLQTLLHEVNDLLRSEETRQEITLGEERKVPIVFRYSIFESASRSPPHRFDSLIIRILADGPEKLEREISEWQEKNSNGRGLEDLLVVIEIPEALRRRLQWSIAAQKVEPHKS
ncbi:MAG: hypothetical protein GF309_00160, partial [Candidatus Lokiarchaeota archaeon]|nr:hypothetical protein [Candidatus Lokiarchaeota archaeon]